MTASASHSARPSPATCTCQGSPSAITTASLPGARHWPSSAARVDRTFPFAQLHAALDHRVARRPFGHSCLVSRHESYGGTLVFDRGRGKKPSRSNRALELFASPEAVGSGRRALTAIKAARPAGRILPTMVEIEVRLFNSLARYARRQGPCFPLRLAPAATVGDALAQLAIPRRRIFVLWLNGHNIKAGVGFDAAIEEHLPLASGDVLALSGPIPYSSAYGTPVC